MNKVSINELIIDDVFASSIDQINERFYETGWNAYIHKINNKNLYLCHSSEITDLSKHLPNSFIVKKVKINFEKVISFLKRDFEIFSLQYAEVQSLKIDGIGRVSGKVTFEGGSFKSSFWQNVTCIKFSLKNHSGESLDCLLYKDLNIELNPNWSISLEGKLFDAIKENYYEWREE